MATQVGSNWNSVNNWFAANGIAPVQQTTSFNAFEGLGNIATQSNQQVSSISGMDINGADVLRDLGLGNTIYDMAGVSQQDAALMFGGNPYTGESLSYAQAFQDLADSAPDYLPGVKRSLSAVNSAVNQLFGGSDFNSDSSLLPDIPQPIENTATTTQLPAIPEPEEAGNTATPDIPEPVTQAALPGEYSSIRNDKLNDGIITANEASELIGNLTALGEMGISEFSENGKENSFIKRLENIRDGKTTDENEQKALASDIARILDANETKMQGKTAATETTNTTEADTSMNASKASQTLLDHFDEIESENGLSTLARLEEVQKNTSDEKLKAAIEWFKNNKDEFHKMENMNSRSSTMNDNTFARDELQKYHHDAGQ